MKWITNIWLEPGGEVVRDPGLDEDPGQEPRWYYQEEKESPGGVRGQQVEFFILFFISRKWIFVHRFLFQDGRFLYFAFFVTRQIFFFK